MLRQSQLLKMLCSSKTKVVLILDIVMQIYANCVLIIHAKKKKLTIPIGRG